jgi:maleylpyruvate isomerase
VVSDEHLQLHGYWRSTAAYRVRIALGLKRLSYEQTTHDLRASAHGQPAYRDLAPQGLVPALDTGAAVLTQSLAIIEWLDETHPMPPLLPANPVERAVVRAMADAVACDIHPLNNLRVLQALRSEFGASPAQVDAWIARWITEGFTALEAMIARHGGAFAFGDAPTMADCCLTPQVYSAERFKVELAPFPRIRGTVERARALAPFAAAHPDRQPDADRP